MLIQRTVIVIFTVLGNERGSALVKHSWQEGITAQPAARTSRGTLSEIWCRDVMCVHSVIFLSFSVLFRLKEASAGGFYGSENGLCQKNQGPGRRLSSSRMSDTLVRSPWLWLILAERTLPCESRTKVAG